MYLRCVKKIYLLVFFRGCSTPVVVIINVTCVLNRDCRRIIQFLIIGTKIRKYKGPRSEGTAKQNFIFSALVSTQAKATNNKTTSDTLCIKAQSPFLALSCIMGFVGFVGCSVIQMTHTHKYFMSSYETVSISLPMIEDLSWNTQYTSD